jgi:hypothetical protein
MYRCSDHEDILFISSHNGLSSQCLASVYICKERPTDTTSTDLVKHVIRPSGDVTPTMHKVKCIE